MEINGSQMNNLHKIIKFFYDLDDTIMEGKDVPV